MRSQLPSVLLIAVLALNASGCAVLMTGTHHEGGTGSLSDATAQIADSSTTVRYKPTATTPPDVGWTVVPPPADEPSVAVGPPPAPPEEQRLPRVRNRRLFAGATLGGGTLAGADYEGFGGIGLMVGGYPERRVRVDGTISLSGLEMRRDGSLDRVLRDAVEVSLDVTVRYYLTPDHTLMSLYPLAGVGTGTMFWDYARPVTVIENGAPKRLDSDDINHFSVFAGAGISLIQTRYVHVGGNATAGVRFWGRHTDSGLKNDLLRTTGYLRVIIELCFRVAKV